MLKLKTYNKAIANTVGADGPVRPLFREHTKNTPVANSNPNSKIQTLTSDPKGITLIALIITIIVMLILVGVTINVALDGGLFEKAKKATYQTEISEIQEQAEVEKAIEIAENSGNIPKEYKFTLDDLDISNSLKEKYKDKLTVSNGILYYKDDQVTSKTEQNWLEEMGITAFKEPVNEHHGIHVGDEWTNVTFDNLPETEPEDMKNVQVVVQDNQLNILWIIIFMNPDGCNTFSNCIFIYGIPFSISDTEIVESDSSGWYLYRYVWSGADKYDGNELIDKKWCKGDDSAPDFSGDGISGSVVGVSIGDTYNDENDTYKEWLGMIFECNSFDSDFYIDNDFANWLHGNIEYAE